MKLPIVKVKILKDIIKITYPIIDFCVCAIFEKRIEKIVIGRLIIERTINKISAKA